MDKNRAKLAGWLAYHQNQRHLLVLRDSPDSDALLSAAAHQRIGHSFSIQTDIVAIHELAHPHHQALANLLGMSIVIFKDHFSLSRYDGVIFLSDPRQTDIAFRQAQNEAGVPTLLIVSHGSNTLLEEADTIVIPEGKAASSLYASFLQGAAGHEPVWTLEGKIRPASVGVNNSGGKAGAEAARGDATNGIGAAPTQSNTENSGMSYSANVMEVLRRALTTRASHKDLSAAGIGYLSAEDLDSLAIAAELLTREEGIFRSIVFAIVRDVTDQERLHGVYWNKAEAADPTGFLRSIFEDEEMGTKFLREDRMAGSFSLPLGPTSRSLPKGTQMMQWSYYEILTLKKIASALLGEPH